jgi:Tfp pilus assembly protein PilX
MKTITINRQAGAVSLFVVVFFMLLATVVTVSFTRLMIADQRQASDNDLSQSAYDSAQAGVEDAKRALLQYKSECLFTPSDDCGRYSNRISSDVCNYALAGVAGTGLNLGSESDPYPEVMIQQTNGGTSNDSDLNQAYTCVTIDLSTDDYVGTIQANQSQLVPLKSEGAFNRVKVEWFNKEDISTNGTNSSINVEGVSSGRPLYSQGQWPLNRPSLLRTQLIQVANSGFTLPNFDTVSGDQSNGATLFLYPTLNTRINESIIDEISMTGSDQRKTDANDDPNPKDALLTPSAVSCRPNLNDGGYACSTVLVLPQAIGAQPGDDTRTAFMRLTSLYNATHYRVTLWNTPVTDSATPTQFKDVQPMVDSTGRANDLFRRVQSRVDLFDTTFPYPEATIDLTGNFCKDFAVTTDQYIAGTSGCNP